MNLEQNPQCCAQKTQRWIVGFRFNWHERNPHSVIMGYFCKVCKNPFVSFITNKNNSYMEGLDKIREEGMKFDAELSKNSSCTFV